MSHRGDLQRLTAPGVRRYRQRRKLVTWDVWALHILATLAGLGLWWLLLMVSR